LEDAVPKRIVDGWVEEHRRWLELNPPPRSVEQQEEQTRRFGRKLLKYLDRGCGRCLLADAGARAEVVGAMTHFEGQRYVLGEYVVMPNHVHVLVMPLGEEELADIVASWTRYSAVRINRCWKRSGSVWQGEPFDHIVRHRVAYQRSVEYIRGNPRGLAEGRATVGHGELRW
jgi:hypothetical protein